MIETRAMRRILLVDDDPNVRPSLRDLARPQRAEWDLVFATGRDAALDALGAVPFDVVLTDFGATSGSALFAEVRERFPQVVRIALASGELGPAMSAMAVAHQCLAKPTDAGTLHGVVDRLVTLQGLLHDARIRATIGEVDTLPSPPAVFDELMELVSRPETGAAEVAEVVERDVAMSAKLLQLVNSAFFGLPRRVANTREAVSYLGVNLVRNLVMSMSVFAMFSESKVPGFCLDALEEHAVACAGVARRLGENPALVDDAALAAMLQDVGKLVLAARMPEVLAELIAEARREGLSLHEIERLRLGTDHGRIGAYLLGIWALPMQVVEAVAFHHDPEEVPHGGFDVVDAVALAHRLVQAHRPDAADPDDTSDGLDAAWLERVGAADRLYEWESLVACSPA